MMTEQELKEIRELCEIAEAHPNRINDWEQEFLNSIISRVTRYQEETFLSEKQHNMLEKVREKLYSF